MVIFGSGSEKPVYGFSNLLSLCILIFMLRGDK